MDRRDVDPNGRAPTEDDLMLLIGRITTAAVFAGLAFSDAEDLAQDVLTWLVASGNLETALSAPWRTIVVRNFLLRHLRRRWREGRQRPVAGAERRSVAPELSKRTEAKLFLERLAARSPLRERRLIELMAGGLLLSEAARRVGIRHGSEQHYLCKIRARAMRLSRTIFSQGLLDCPSSPRPSRQ